MRVKRKQLVLLAAVSLLAVTSTGMIGISMETGRVTALPSADPACQWLTAGGTPLENGSTLLGPGATLTVNWTGGDQSIVNNTLAFQTGTLVNRSGVLLNTSDDQTLQVYLPAGNYYFELGWNDSNADVDAYVFLDPGFQTALFSVYAMATSLLPENTTATMPADGNIWIAIDYFSNSNNVNDTVNYYFLIRSDDYSYFSGFTAGPDQVFDTSSIPDETYTVTATCFDAAGNNFTSTLILTVQNQFTPEIDWVTINSNSIDAVDNPEFERGTAITIEWQASDNNTGDAIFANLYYREPGDDVYSLLFGFLNVTEYRINWDTSAFDENGYYLFKLEVYNYGQEPGSTGTAEFDFTIVEPPANTTTTGTGSGGTSSSPVNGTPAFTFVSLLAMLLLLPLVRHRQKKR